MRHFYSCTECVGPPECGRIHEHQLSCMVCVWWCRMLGWGSFIITDVSIISHRKHKGFTTCCCSNETACSFTKKDMLYLFWTLTMSSVRVCGPFFSISLPSFPCEECPLSVPLCVFILFSFAESYWVASCGRSVSSKASANNWIQINKKIEKLHLKC